MIHPERIMIWHFPVNDSYTVRICGMQEYDLYWADHVPLIHMEPGHNPVIWMEARPLERVGGKAFGREILWEYAPSELRDFIKAVWGDKL